MKVLSVLSILALAVALGNAFTLPGQEIERRCSIKGSSCSILNPGVCCSETCECSLSGCTPGQLEGIVNGFCE